MSHPVDAELAAFLQRLACDGIIAPAYDKGVVGALAGKKRGTFLVLEGDPAFEPPARRYARCTGCASPSSGTICRWTDRSSTGSPGPDDLLLGMIVLRYTQSNSVAFLKDGMALGIGAGQQSRIDCTQLAGQQGADVVGPAVRRRSVAAMSRWCRTARIPFVDNIVEAHRHGVRYLAEPGGSIRSAEVAAACAKLGISLSQTGAAPVPALRGSRPAPAIPRRWEDHQLVAVGQGGAEAVEVADVVVAQVDVDVASDGALLVGQASAAGPGPGRRTTSPTVGLPSDLDPLGPTRERSQHGRQLRTTDRSISAAPTGGARRVQHDRRRCRGHLGPGSPSSRWRTPRRRGRRSRGRSGRPAVKASRMTGAKKCVGQPGRQRRPGRSAVGRAPDPARPPGGIRSRRPPAGRRRRCPGRADARRSGTRSRTAVRPRSTSTAAAVVGAVDAVVVLGVHPFRPGGVRGDLVHALAELRATGRGRSTP